MSNPDADEILIWGCSLRHELIRGRLPHDTVVPKSNPGHPATVAVECPCGEEHRVSAMTRPGRPGETFDVDPVVIRGLPKRRRR